MDAAEGTPRPYGPLAHQLGLLASEVRLELLNALRTPRLLNEIRLHRPEAPAGEGRPRSLARQTVTWHLDQLQRLGLVVREPAETKGRGDRFALHHERLFAVVDDLHNLTKLRPIGGRSVPPSSTVARSGAAGPRLPEPPRLVVAYGQEDGIGYSLEGPPGTTWHLGRAPACEIRLDYDPYVSSENTRLERTAQGFLVHDVSTSRNGTWVNWERLPRGGSRPIRPGDVLIVGRSSLVFQP